MKFLLYILKFFTIRPETKVKSKPDAIEVEEPKKIEEPVFIEKEKIMSVKDNKWLIVKDNVVLTPIIEPVIIELDAYFEKHKLKAYVTSGLRDADDQLRVVRSYLKRKGLDSTYPDAMTCKVDERLSDGTYKWQRGWSALLNVGVIINPPFRAVCLMNYIRNGVNKKGQWIGQTPHAGGTAFNVGGGSNGIMDELAVLNDALKEKKIKGLKSFLAERENNALHVNCR